MGATSVLIRKELSQHWLAFAFLASLLTLLAGSLLAWHLFRGVSSSVFLGTGTLLQFALPGAAMVICGRLVLAEYRAHTQLFLEALPLARWHMVLVKYLLGLTAMLLFLLLLLVGAGALFSAHEAMTLLFAAILGSRAVATAFFWYSFFFTTGLLGRYRWPIYILIIFLGFFVDAWTSWDVRRFGPFELLDQSFGSERYHFPVEALKSSLGCGAVLAVVGFILALVREGNVSALLAERMSHREKVFVAAIILSAISAIGIFDDRRVKAPYDLSGAVVADAPGVLVKIAGPEESAKPLANHLAAELGALREYLGIHAFPPVLVTHREDLDAAKFERGELSKAEGFVVRANYTASDFSSERFVAWLIPELLDHRSHDRTKLERGRWIRDGLGEFWVRRANVSAPLAADREVALRALYAAPAGVTADQLHEWYRTREHLGEGVAVGLAWSGLKAIVSLAGEDGCRAFLREMYAPEVPQDVRATVHDRQYPWPERLQHSAKLSVEDLIRAWSRMLSSGRDAFAADLARLPRLELTIQQHAATEQTTLLKWRLTAAASPVDEVEYRIRYLRPPGLDEPFDEDDMLDEAARAKLDPPIEKELAESFSRGSRAVIGAAVHIPELGCDVISGWQRLDIGP